MKEISFILFFTLLTTTIAFTQSCLPNGIEFDSQAQVDSFPYNYPNCSEIEGYVKFFGTSINNIDSLSNITSIGGTLEINTTSLTNLEGFINLTSIGNLYIRLNLSLTNLSGLDNIDPNSIQDIRIFQNWSLTDCSIQSICNYLESPNGIVRIYNNATGCNNPPEIASKCGFVMSCLPFGYYHFMTQLEIDSFHADYQGCTELNGLTIITGDEISNLNGLNCLTSINGTISIDDTELLENLEGLNNVDTINGILSLTNNNSIVNLSGLSSLISVNEHLIISFENNSITNLHGLENLEFIGGFLEIYDNQNIISLEGLGINTTIMGNLVIEENSSLTTCEVQSICNYLANPSAGISIEDNATGCNNQTEVEEACLTSVNPNSIKQELLIYPNPSTSTIFIKNIGKTEISEVTMYNLLGQKAYHKKGITNHINISGLIAGYYNIELVINNKIYRQKIIKQ